MKFKQTGLTLTLLSLNTLAFANTNEMGHTNLEEQNNTLQNIIFRSNKPSQSRLYE